MYLVGGVISQDEIDTINRVLKNLDISKVVLFGSKAKGNYKTDSDVDLAIDAF